MKAHAIVVAVLAIAAAGCGGSEDASSLPTGAEAVDLDPADFSAEIDHPYWPMPVGAVWTYRETDGDGGGQRVVVTVTGRTREIMGIQARVVHDVVTEEGAIVEDTYDWYAQDDQGNVWYLGEDTTAFENGGPAGKDGSWEAGVDGGQAGILLPGDPAVGSTYRQEYLEGEAEDAAEVLSLDEKVEVPFGRFDGVLMTKDFTPLEPDLLEHKFYARGVGPVLAVTVSGGKDREELVDFKRPG
jgi:hypothetical protein